MRRGPGPCMTGGGRGPGSRAVGEKPSRVCRAGHRSVLVRRRRTAAECHDFGPAEESGQSVPVRSGMLKSRGCDTMTGAGGSFLGWGSESRERNGLGRSASGRCAPIGKTSRNMNEGRRTTAFGKGQARLDGVAVTVRSLPWTRWTSCRRARGTIICAVAPEQNYAAG